MRMKKSDIVRTHTCTMIIIALFFLEIKWYEEEFRKLAAALIVKKLTLNTAKSTDCKSVFSVCRKTPGLIRGRSPLCSIRLWRHVRQNGWKPKGFRTFRVLPPGGPPQRVSSGPFPGAEPHVFCKAKSVKTRKSGVQPLFRKSKAGTAPAFCLGKYHWLAISR